MEATRWQQIDALVDAALDLPESERADFVARSSDGDPELTRMVTELLGAHDVSGEFLENSAMKIVAMGMAQDAEAFTPQSLLNTKIAKYQVESKIGAGGMGEVYLATDEKLKRKVALKILPPEFVSNDERVKRFEMEAHAISSLNHPNIVTIYDVGNFEGINYIATEFVEGKTLRELIGGRFKLRNVMANSIQICDALSAAHQAGIIHRDIKPENIMIRDDGYAKILDFGVAKLTEAGAETMSNFAKTSKGIIVGTPAYMSPGQVSGDVIDQRSDLWSCGVVLYEFLTGKNPFKRQNRQATFQAILSEDPPPCSSLNPEIPEELDHILMKALEKDPDLGYQNAADFRADLKRVKRLLDSSPSGTHSGRSSQYSTRIRNKTFPARYTGAAAAAVILVAGVLLTIFWKSGTKSTGTEWAGATSVQLTDNPGTEYFPTLSPDGKTVVYAAENNGNLDLFALRVGGKNPRNLTPDSAGDDTQPAFSPDGERIAFRSSRKPAGIYVMGATGENVKKISDFGFHPSWSPDGKEIVVSKWGRDMPDVRNGSPSELSIINVASGERRVLASNDAMQPAWSPDGKKIAYWFFPPSAGRRDVAIIPAAGGEPVVITKDGTTNWNPVWSPDSKFLYFVSDRGGNMGFWRVAVDETGHPTSQPEAVVTPSKYSRHLAFSGDGKRLIYVSTDNRSNLRLLDFDLPGLKVTSDPVWVTQGDRQVSRPELSPDGSRFVFRLPRRSQDDIVTLNRDGSNQVDITDDTAFDRYPRWSPDGKRIAFTSDRTGVYQIHVVDADGTNLRRLTESADKHATFPIWSPDGTKIECQIGGSNYLIDPNKNSNEQTPVALPRFEDPQVTFSAWDWSPDGTKLAGTFGGSPMRMGYYSIPDQQFFPLADSAQLPMWMPGGGKILYGSENSILLFDILSGRSKELLKTSEQITGLGISHDGQMIYYVSTSSESDIWMLDAVAAK